MPVLRYQVALERVGALPKDVVVNTWTFDTDQTVGEDADDISGRLVAFYQAIGPSILSNLLTGNGHIKAYDLADAVPRVPVFEQDFTFTKSGSDPLPAECAIVLSMRAEYVAGESRARRRGRVFLGPLPVSVRGATAVGGDVAITTASMTTILTAAETLATGPDPGDGRLAVYSPTADAVGATLEDATHDVVELWIDNRLDTQRRRGGAPTARQVVPVT